jgi:beta-N-acetylhexosaminidase
MKFRFALFLTVLLTVSCSSKMERLMTQRELRRNRSAAQVQKMIDESCAAQKKAIEDFIDSLPQDQKISQLFLVNIEGNKSYAPVENAFSLSSVVFQKDTDKKKSASCKNEPLVPGGCLLFSYNIAKTPAQLLSFTESIADYCRERSIVPPYTALDQEGGIVNRLRGITEPLDSEQGIAETLTPQQAYAVYSEQAKKMSSFLLDMNLAPVAEISTPLNSSFLQTRSFGSLSKAVSYSKAAVCAYENNGVASVIKHFPGNSDTDPHSGLPEIHVTENQMNTMLVAPFAQIIPLAPEAVLMSHARVSALDGKTPACLSYEWVTGMLRNKMKYRGLIISDDIFMAALAQNGFPPEKAAVQAIDAGVDVLMMSEKKYANAARILLEKAADDESFAQRINESVYRVISFKIRHGILELRYTGSDGKNSSSPSYLVCIPHTAKRGDTK